jgi:hypothetical protein
MREILLAAAGVASITASAVLWAGQPGVQAPQVAGLSIYDLHLAQPVKALPEQPIPDSI